MLRNSFIFLPGISEAREQRIWEQGVRSHDDFLFAESIKGVSKKKKLFYDRRLREAKKAIYDGDSAYFIGLLPPSEMWRLYSTFRDEAIFMDIEVSNVDGGYPTIIGLYDGCRTMSMVKDINLDYNVLRDTLNKYKIIVSFNGSVFDVPFIMRQYPAIPKIPHIDLRFTCRRAGLPGGLKGVEKAFGILRSNPLVDRLCSGDPFLLWRTYRATGDSHYLELLLEYNEEDVVNLRRIADIVCLNLESLA